MAVAGVFSSGGARVERGEYGSPESVGAGGQIHLISESFAEQNTGHAITVSGDLELRLAYGGGGLQHVLATLLFCHPDKSPLDLGGGLYLHFFELEHTGNPRVATVWDSSNPSGKRISKRATVFIDRAGESTVEIVSFQPKNITFDLAESSRLTATGEAMRMNTNPEYTTSGLGFSYSPVGMVSIVDATVELFPLHKWNFTSDQSFTITEDGAAPVTVTIPAGEYMAVQLAREIEKQLNSNTSLNGRYYVMWEGDLLSFVLRSNVKFSISNAGIAPKLGFPNGDGLGHVHRSQFPARYDPIATTGIQLGVSDVSIAVDGKLRRDSNLESAWEPPEGRVYELPTIRVTLNLPRPHFWNVGELAGEYFALKISATHSDGVGKMEFFVDTARITTPESPVSGEQQIRQRIPLEGERTPFPQFKLFFDERFMVRDLPPAPSGVETSTVRSFDHRLYAGDGIGGFLRLEQTGWSTITTFGDPISAMAVWWKKLYIGTEGGDLYAYDGNTTSTIGSTGTSAIVAMEPYDNKLYILTATGAVYTYDGTTLAQDTTAPAATVGHDLLATHGKLYSLVRVTNETIYEFNGSSWVSAYSFGATYNTGSLTRLDARKRVVGVAGTAGAYYDVDTTAGGAGWVAYTNPFPEEIKHATTYESELLLVSSAGKLYWREQSGEVDTLLATMGTPVYRKPVAFERRVVVPVGNNLRYVQKPYIFYLTLQDKTPTNPYI